MYLKIIYAYIVKIMIKYEGKGYGAKANQQRQREQ